jgi:hypothetical protein
MAEITPKNTDRLAPKSPRRQRAGARRVRPRMWACTVSLCASLILCSIEQPYADTSNDIKKYCAAKWATDYEMQEYCINKQTQSANRILMEYDNLKPNSEEKNIYSRCLDKWQSQIAGYDWEMVEYCKTKQLEAYRRLH